MRDFSIYLIPTMEVGNGSEEDGAGREGCPLGGHSPLKSKEFSGQPYI